MSLKPPPHGRNPKAHSPRRNIKRLHREAPDLTSQFRDLFPKPRPPAHQKLIKAFITPPSLPKKTHTVYTQGSRRPGTPNPTFQALNATPLGFPLKGSLNGDKGSIIGFYIRGLKNHHTIPVFTSPPRLPGSASKALARRCRLRHVFFFFLLGGGGGSLGLPDGMCRYIYIYMYVSMYVCMYVCMYICVENILYLYIYI